MTDPDPVRHRRHTHWVDPAGVTTTGVDDIDLWVGGLAEKQLVFGGLLGPTFNFVFETQMENLQDGDRFYYLSRTAGLNLLTQLEGNSFAELIQRNTDVSGLPADSFSTPGPHLRPGDAAARQRRRSSTTRTPTCNESTLLTRMPDGTIRYGGGEHVVFNGTAGNNRIWSSEGDDTIRGNDGNDRMEGGDGNDNLIGGLGDDILTDPFGDDTHQGRRRQRRPVVRSGLRRRPASRAAGATTSSSHGNDPTETFAGPGDDFVFAGAGDDTVFGDDGDDWIESGRRHRHRAARSTCCRATTAPRSRTTRTSPATTSSSATAARPTTTPRAATTSWSTALASSATRACSGSTGSPTTATRRRRTPTWPSPACCRRASRPTRTASTWSRRCRAGTSTTSCAATTVTPRRWSDHELTAAGIARVAGLARPAAAAPRRSPAATSCSAAAARTSSRAAAATTSSTVTR